MSTNHDHVVQTLSWWLAGRADLADASRPKLQPLVRETIEAIAHGH